LTPACYEEMAADADEGGLALGPTQCVEDAGADLGIVEHRLDVGGESGEALDGDRAIDGKPGRPHLTGQLVGTVEVGGGEPIRVPRRVVVHSGRYIVSDDACELGLAEEPALKAVKSGRPALIPATTIAPRGRTTRRASRSAESRSPASVKW
jgi:hypothetical protein